MNNLLKEALKQAYVRAQADVVVLHTLEFTHEDMTEPLRIVQGNDAQELWVDGAPVEFLPVPFEFVLPETTDTLPELVLAVDDVMGEASAFVRQFAGTASPVTVLYRPFLEADKQTPQIDPPLQMFLKDAVVKDGVFRARAIIHDFVNKKFPNELYHVKAFPGLQS